MNSLAHSSLLGVCGGGDAATTEAPPFDRVRDAGGVATLAEVADIDADSGLWPGPTSEFAQTLGGGGTKHPSPLALLDQVIGQEVAEERVKVRDRMVAHVKAFLEVHWWSRSRP
jgi:hypothetical protein